MAFVKRTSTRWCPVARGPTGNHGASWRVPASESWRFPEVELRAGNSWPCIVLDMDGANALERLVYHVDQGDVLEPNWAVTRKDGGATHAVWTLGATRSPRRERKGQTDQGAISRG